MYIRCLNTLDPTALPQMKLPWQISHFNSWELCSVRASQEMHFSPLQNNGHYYITYDLLLYPGPLVFALVLKETLFLILEQEKSPE